MKSTGVVRKVDVLGRIVLPIELRRTLNIDIKDGLEIYTEEDLIILRRYQPLCSFCGNSTELVPIKSVLICSKCVEEVKQFK